MSDAIEAACRAHSPQWDGIDPEIQRYAREQMRAALTAYEAAKRSHAGTRAWAEECVAIHGGGLTADEIMAKWKEDEQMTEDKNWPMYGARPIVGHATIDERKHATEAAKGVAFGPRNEAVYFDVDYLMSIIDAAIDDGFDPDEDGPLLDEIRANLKAGRSTSPASGERDALDEMANHPGWELSRGYKDKDGDEDDEYGWCLHEQRGNRNDREWRLLGFGDTPRAAIAAALRMEGK